MEEHAEKRERGSGSIYHNGSAVWWVKFYVRGIPKRESSGSTDYKVAERLLKRRLAEVITKTYVMRANIKIDELITDLVAEYKRERRKSIGHLEMRWKKHLEPFFGRMKVDDINTDTVQRYSAKREAEGVQGPTINRELAVLKRAFNLALACSPPKVRSCPVFPMYAENDPRTGFLKDEEYTRLARECSKEGLWLRTLLTVAYNLAFRKGELLGLRVRQIDLASRTIRLAVGTTKNGDGRTVPMSNEVYELLKACVIGKQQDDSVFTRPDGTPVRDFRKQWSTICVAAKVGALVCPKCEQSVGGEKNRCANCRQDWAREELKYVGLIFHDLRRSGVRNLRRLGVQETVAMRISGHKTRSVFDRYNITDEADLRAAAALLDEKQKSRVPELGDGENQIGQGLGILPENSTKNEAAARLRLTAAVLPN